MHGAWTGIQKNRPKSSTPPFSPFHLQHFWCFSFFLLVLSFRTPVTLSGKIFVLLLIFPVWAGPLPWSSWSPCWGFAKADPLGEGEMGLFQSPIMYQRLLQFLLIRKLLLPTGLKSRLPLSQEKAPVPILLLLVLILVIELRVDSVAMIVKASVNPKWPDWMIVEKISTSRLWPKWLSENLKSKLIPV